MSPEEIQDQFDRTIAVDFDDTIIVKVFGTFVPAKDCIDALNILRDAGYKIMIHSARSWSNWADKDEREEEMRQLLVQWGVPFDLIYVGEGKPPAFAYVDDRGIRFNNNWMDIARLILEKGK